MPTFEYVHQIVRVPVRARKPKKGSKYSQGAYITVPGEWLGRRVKAHLEDNPKEKLDDLEVKGSPPRFTYVSIDAKYAGKNLIVELKPV